MSKWILLILALLFGCALGFFVIFQGESLEKPRGPADCIKHQDTVPC